MIPAGSHSVFYSAVSVLDLYKSTKQGDGKDGRPKYTPANPGPRTGFFVHLKKQQILVKKWDPIHEELVDGATSEEELARFRMGLMDLDQFLGPYPFDNGLRRWLSLSSNITEDTIKNLAPLNGSICSVSTFVDSEDDGKAAADKETPTDNLRRTHDSVIRFSPIPRRCYPPNATAQEITRCSMDRSYTLEVLLNESSPAALLGELQFAFVCFLIGHVYDAFEQWKRFVALICQSEDAITKHSALFHDVIGVIHYQIREAPDDFFIDVISSNNFLSLRCRIYLQT